MFDERDADFWKTRSDPRLGIPMLTENGVIFLNEYRLQFDRYNGFDGYNDEFTNTTVGPRLLPPIMLKDGTICCTRA
jgi:hypothetical protein